MWCGPELLVCMVGRKLRTRATETLMWVTIHKKSGPVLGRNSSDADLGCYTLLMNNFVFFGSKKHAWPEGVVTSLSPAKMPFGGMLCSRVVRRRAPQPRFPVCEWFAARVCEASRCSVLKEGSSVQPVKGQRIDRDQQVEAGAVAWSGLAVERCAPIQLVVGMWGHMWGHWETPSFGYWRWNSSRNFGTKTSRVDEHTHCCGCGTGSWTGSVGLGFIDLRRRRTSRTWHGGYDFFQRHIDSLIGKPGTRSTICIRLDNTWAYAACTDDNVSISDGRLSPDFGEMWKYGCPRSLERDSEYDGEMLTERRSRRGANMMWNVRCVLEGLHGESQYALTSFQTISYVYTRCRIPLSS